LLVAVSVLLLMPAGSARPGLTLLLLEL